MGEDLSVERLSRKHVEAVYHLLSVLGRKATRTEIVKLMFLVDRELARRGLKPLFRWVRWYYGPFSRGVLEALDMLEELGLVAAERVVDIETLTLKKVEYQVVKPYAVKELDPCTRRVIEDTAYIWRGRRLEELIRYVYTLPEVRTKKLGEVIRLE